MEVVGGHRRCGRGLTYCRLLVRLLRDGSGIKRRSTHLLVLVEDVQRLDCAHCRCLYHRSRSSKFCILLKCIVWVQVELQHSHVNWWGVSDDCGFVPPSTSFQVPFRASCDKHTLAYHAIATISLTSAWPPRAANALTPTLSPHLLPRSVARSSAKAPDMSNRGQHTSKSRRRTPSSLRPSSCAVSPLL